MSCAIHELKWDEEEGDWVDIGLVETRYLLETRRSALEAADRLPGVYAVVNERSFPEDFDTTGLTVWPGTVLRKFESVGVDGFLEMIDLFGTEFAAMAALGVYGVDGWIADSSTVIAVLEKQAVSCLYSSGARALAYLIIYFFNDQTAKDLGCEYDAMGPCGALTEWWLR